MPPKNEPKPKLGRKRKYPEGSAEHRVKVPPDVQAALEGFVARQPVPPDDGAVILAALKKFLADAGDLKASPDGKRV